jgi:hypothetical protein
VYVVPPQITRIRLRKSRSSQPATGASACMQSGSCVWFSVIYTRCCSETLGRTQLQNWPTGTLPALVRCTPGLWFGPQATNTSTSLLVIWGAAKCPQCTESTGVVSLSTVSSLESPSRRCCSCWVRVTHHVSRSRTWWKYSRKAAQPSPREDATQVQGGRARHHHSLRDARKGDVAKIQEVLFLVTVTSLPQRWRGITLLPL